MKTVLVSKALSGVYFKASSDIELLNEFDGETGQFLKTFAINDKRNKNGWRATWEGIKKYIHTFKGRPGIEFIKCDSDGCDLDHTEAQTKEMSLTVQEPFRVTTIVGYTLDENTHTAYFIHKADDPGFYQKAESKEIKYVSPSIWPEEGGFEVIGTTENGAPKIDVWKWSGLHDAYVNKPAFGDEAKITAICEGANCPVKLLSAKVLKADALQDCVSRKISEVFDKGEKPDKQKIAIFFSECREAMSAQDEKSTKLEANYRYAAGEKRCSNCKFFDASDLSCKVVEGIINPDFTSNLYQPINSSGIVSPDNIPHLQQIPLLINHNKKKRFIGVTQRAYQAVNKLLEAGETVDESKIFDIIRQDKENSSFNSCTCSASKMPTDEEYNDMKSKLQAIEKDKEDLTSKLTANDDEKKDEMKARKARLVAVLSAQDDEEREKTAKAIRAQDDEKEKEALDEAEKDVKTAKKGKYGQEDEEKEEQNAKIAALESKIAEPLVAKLVKARQLKGATEDEINNFTESMKTKSLKAVTEQYDSEKVLIEEALSGVEEEIPQKKSFPLMGSEGQALSGKSLEETFQEVTA